MQSLNVLINQGKVLYLGISDAPAWIVTKANMYARQHGLRPFSLYQGRYSAQERDLEREIIPMCRDEGMAIQPFGVLGGGYFKSPGDEGNGARQVTPTVLDPIAKKHQVPITSVALAYVLQKVSFHCLFSYILPVIRHNPSSY
jgi:aryl-alcohol dehydrogenase-like predicted oxidoreductase